MGLASYIQIEPVRTHAAVLAFGGVLITALAYSQHWSGDAVGLISGAWTSFNAIIATLIIREKVTANQAVDQKVHDTIVALAPYAPVVTEAIVPVASSPLLDTSVVVTDNSVSRRPVGPAFDVPQRSFDPNPE